MNKSIGAGMSSHFNNLKFILLNIDSTRLAVLADNSFVSNRDYISEHVFVSVLAERPILATVMRYCSFEAEVMTWNVLGAEIFALAHTMHNPSNHRSTITKSFFKDITMTFYTNRKSFYSKIVGIILDTEQYFSVALNPLSKRFEVGRIVEVLTIPFTHITMRKRWEIYLQVPHSQR